MSPELPYVLLGYGAGLVDAIAIAALAAYVIRRRSRRGTAMAAPEPA